MEKVTSVGPPSLESISRSPLFHRMVLTADKVEPKFNMPDPAPSGVLFTKVELTMLTVEKRLYSTKPKPAELPVKTQLEIVGVLNELDMAPPKPALLSMNRQLLMTGEAFTFVVQDDEPLVRQIETVLGERIERRRLPGFDYRAAPEGQSRRTQPRQQQRRPGRSHNSA